MCATINAHTVALTVMAEISIGLMLNNAKKQCVKLHNKAHTIIVCIQYLEVSPQYGETLVDWLKVLKQLILTV